MSELEILRRQQYKRNRKRWAMVQIIAIVLLATMALVSFLIYNRMNRTQYIEYVERGSIDYLVQYKDNAFFPDEWIDKDQSYISSLVKGLTADFVYRMDTSSDEMKFDFKYSINAKMLIASKDKGTPYYTVEENLVPSKSGKIENRDYLEVKESVVIDFERFDDIAREFVETYGLEASSSCTLIVTLDVDTECANNGFSQRNDVLYSTSLNIPLATDTFNVHRTSLSTEGEAKVLEYVGGAHKEFFLTLSTGSAVLAALFALILLAFLHLTKNEDITYAAKVRKILRSYGSFIQRMDGEFDCEGYQVLNIRTFVEMLGIRDTIQSPVLMSENKDETMTRFFIPTSTKILYVFEIKVDNYDDIYGTREEMPYDDLDDDGYGPEPTAEAEPEVEETPVEAIAEEVIEEAVVEEAEPVTEPEPIPEPVAEEPVTVIEETPVEETPVEEPAPITHAPIDELAVLDKLIETTDSEDGDEDILAYIDEEGNIVRITCSRSFTANLIQSNPQVRDYYNQIKNHILSYKGVKARMSWRNESYKKGRIQLFKMKIRGKTICLYCALNPEDYSSTKYFHETATAKVYAQVPMMVRIKSDRGLRRAKELVDDVMRNFAILPDEKAVEVDHTEGYPFDTTKNLVRRGLIKLLLPDAILAEPKPHDEPKKPEEPKVEETQPEAVEETQPEVVEETQPEVVEEAQPEVVEESQPEEETVVEVVKEDVVEEIVLFGGDSVDDTVIEEIVAEPTPELENIDYDDASEEVTDFVETVDNPGVDVIGVVWPERPHKNKIYRYDPDGEEVSVGDVVIVPTRDVHSNKDVVRKAAVAHANHKVPAEDLKHPLKKIVGVIRKKIVTELQQPTEPEAPAKPKRVKRVRKIKK